MSVDRALGIAANSCGTRGTSITHDQNTGAKNSMNTPSNGANEGIEIPTEKSPPRRAAVVINDVSAPLELCLWHPARKASGLVTATRAIPFGDAWIRTKQSRADGFFRLHMRGDNRRWRDALLHPLLQRRYPVEQIRSALPTLAMHH